MLICKKSEFPFFFFFSDIFIGLGDHNEQSLNNNSEEREENNIFVFHFCNFFALFPSMKCSISCVSVHNCFENKNHTKRKHYEN